LSGMSGMRGAFKAPPPSDIQRLRASIGTNPRNMNEPFDSASLHLSRDPFGRLGMYGMKRFLSPLDVKADGIHCAVSVGKRVGN
jgi:hypothetical protein